MNEKKGKGRQEKDILGQRNFVFQGSQQEHDIWKIVICFVFELILRWNKFAEKSPVNALAYIR